VYVTPPEPTEPAVYATVAEALPAVAVPIVGALGLMPGVIEFDDDDAFDSTPVFDIAVTVNVTAVPAVKPVTVIGELEPVAV
jgi:tRNA (Thr-GGU) A37 N-methylase